MALFLPFRSRRSYLWDQAGLIASTGQADEQAPQSMHADSSITYVLSPAEIAETGHSPSHEPQEIHASEIL